MHEEIFHGDITEGEEMAKTTYSGNPETRNALKLLREAASRIAESGIRIERAFLFGSFARGQVGKWSDIDVAFVSPDYRPSDPKQWARIATICQKVDVRMEPVIYHPNDFPNKDPLAAVIRRTGISLPLR
jgi:predicted nucleotidyltransferase